MGLSSGPQVQVPELLLVSVGPPHRRVPIAKRSERLSWSDNLSEYE